MILSFIILPHPPPKIAQSRVALDEFEDAPGGVGDGVFGRNVGVGAVGVLVDDEGDGVEDAVGVEAGEDDGAGVLGFGALHGLAEGDGREGKDGGLFADGAAV